MSNTSRAFSWPSGKQAAVSLSFDDARASQIDRGIPILDAHGVRATFYVSLPALEARVEDWRAVVKMGHEIGNHSVLHPCSGNFAWSRGRALEDYTLERMDAELDEANERIRRSLGVTPSTFAYPCGQTFIGRGADLKSYVPLVAEKFVAGRLFRSETSIDPAFCDLSHLPAYDGDDQPWDTYRKWIETAASNGSWLVIAGHNVGTGGVQTTRADALEALCRYCQDPAHGIWIDTVDAVASHIHRTRQV